MKLKISIISVLILNNIHCSAMKLELYKMPEKKILIERISSCFMHKLKPWQVYAFKRHVGKSDAIAQMAKKMLSADQVAHQAQLVIISAYAYLVKTRRAAPLEKQAYILHNQRTVMAALLQDSHKN